MWPGLETGNSGLRFWRTDWGGDHFASLINKIYFLISSFHSAQVQRTATRTHRNHKETAKRNVSLCSWETLSAKSSVNLLLLNSPAKHQPTACTHNNLHMGKCSRTLIWDKCQRLAPLQHVSRARCTVDTLSLSSILDRLVSLWLVQDHHQCRRAVWDGHVTSQRMRTSHILINLTKNRINRLLLLQNQLKLLPHILFRFVKSVSNVTFQ